MVVVLRMVDAVRPVEGHVHDRHADEVQEHRVVRAAAEAVVHQVGACRVGQRALQAPGAAAPGLGQRDARRRVLHDVGGLLDEAVQRGHRRGREGGARRRAVDVDVGDRPVAQHRLVLLAPFGRRRERELLGVPAGKDDGALRPDAAAGQRAERADEIGHRRRSARRVHAAVLPRIAVIAEDDELFGLLAALERADDGLDRPHPVVRGHLQPHRCRARPGPVPDAEASLPGRRRLGSAHRLQQHPCVARRQRRADDLRQRDGLLGGHTASASDRRPPGRQRIARDHEVVRDAAGLDVAFVAPRAVGIDRAPGGAVLGRVGVDQHRRRAPPLGRQRLEAAIAVRDRVADQHDPAADVDALGVEPVVVLGVAAGRVHDGRLDGARPRVRVVVEQGRLGVGVARNGVFGETGLPASHGQRHRRRVGQQHLVLDDLDRVEPVLLPQVAQPFGQVPVPVRAGDVRLIGEIAVVIACPVRGGQGEEAPFQLPLRGDGGRREPEDVARGGLRADARRSRSRGGSNGHDPASHRHLGGDSIVRAEYASAGCLVRGAWFWCWVRVPSASCRCGVDAGAS